MSDFPVKFNVSAEATPGISLQWTAKENHSAPITCAIPAEFHGPGNGYSPEGLFGISVLSCIIAIYKVYCEKNDVKFTNLDAQAVLSMDYASDNLLVITEIDIIVNINGASDKEKARSYFEKAIQQCPVGNSIKCGKTFKINVN